MGLCGLGAGAGLALIGFIGFIAVVPIGGGPGLCQRLFELLNLFYSLHSFVAMASFWVHLWVHFDVHFEPKMGETFSPFFALILAPILIC